MPEKIIELPWGADKVRLTLDERFRARVVNPEQAHPLKDLQNAAVNALKDPVGDPLEYFCRATTRVLIIVSDRTRVTGVKQYLPLLRNFLLDSGISDENIQVLVATGMHTPSGRKKPTDFLPADIVGRLRVSEHDCRDSSNHFYAGRTSRGTHVRLDRKVAEADLVLLTGSIGFHYFAGFRGGRKSILPGVAAMDSISSNHRLTIQENGGFHPLCKNASLEGNPVHEDMMESLKMIPTAFLFNTIVDERGQIVKLFAGDPVRAHARGCGEFRARAEVRVPEKAQCVIVSCGGYPKDSTFVQAHKAMENVSSALKEAGSMVVLARCDDGVGSDTLPDWFARGGPAEIRRELVVNYTLHGHTALSCMEKASRFKIYFVSGLRDDVVSSAGLIPAASVREALADVIDRTSGEISTLVFPEGSETLPLVDENTRGL
jgi:nickel-dependent lactate racemase